MGQIVFTPELRKTAGDMGVPVRYIAPEMTRDSADDVIHLRLPEMYRKVPEVRTVIGFIARSVAGVPVHVFKRKGVTDRERVLDGDLARLLGEPSPGLSRFEWMESLVADLAVFDRAYCRKVRDQDGVLVALVRVPPAGVTAIGDGLLGPDAFDVVGSAGVDRVKPEDMMWMAGHDPDGGWHGTPVLDSLRDDLAEVRELARARRLLWERGPRASGIVTRATQWPNEVSRQRFLTGLSRFGAGAERAGSTMLLDDGMQYQPLNGTSFKDSQAIEGRGFVRTVVASAFGVPLTLLGDSDGATYATATAQRRTLYSEVLSAWFARIAGALNGQVVPELAGPGVFVEFVVEAKLRGAFEEQAQVLSSSVGGPWMTRNEARARMNLPALGEGDQLIVPLNVTEGGQASPRDVEGRPADPGSESAGKARQAGAEARVRVKSGGTDAEGERRGVLEDVLRRHFGRQATVVLAALRNGSTDWWDGPRWDRELGKDLHDAAVDMVRQIGPGAADALGFDSEDFDLGRTVEWLRVVSSKRASWINESTRARVAEALESVPVDGEDAETPAAVFEEAATSRVVPVAAGLTATISGFAVTEAARQLAPARAVKTWVVGSANPRASHAAMDGESVPVGDAFSNGMQWPGDPVGGVDEVAGCTCGVTVDLSD